MKTILNVLLGVCLPMARPEARAVG